MTDMANICYGCGKLSLKLLIFRLIITHFGTLTIAPDCTILIKKNPRGDARGLPLLPPDTSCLNVNVIIFCTNVHIWINLGEKYGTKFGLLIYYTKNC